MTVTVWPARENLQSFSALWRFEQGQASTDFNPRKNKDKFERLVTCLVRLPGMFEARPGYRRSGSLASVAQGVVGPPAN